MVMSVIERNRISAAELRDGLSAFGGPRPHGVLTRLVGQMARTNLRDVRMGDLVSLTQDGASRAFAEIAGFDDDGTLLNIFGSTEELDLSVRVEPLYAPLSVPVGDGLLGRVLDSVGQPVDGLGPIDYTVKSPVRRRPPDAMRRPLIDKTLSTGVRVIDGMLTLGVGQRIGIFGSPGSGKSTLLAQIASQTETDICVLCLVGERGRELREFLDRSLPPEKRANIVVVVETSDKPAGLRMIAGHTAMAIAEYFRDEGQSVLFMLDSVTRFARALREVGVALGLPPSRRGFTPNVFEELPRLFERAGRTETGSITGIFTTLSEGDGLDDPIVEEVQSLLDGHIHLSEDLGRKGHFPAVDVLRSKSRLMADLVSSEHIIAANKTRSALAALDEVSFLLKVGEYQKGSDPKVDKALAAKDAIDAFLRQTSEDKSSFEETLKHLEALL